MNISEALRPLPKKNKAEAVWLLSAILNKSKAQIFLEPDYILSNVEAKKFNSGWDRRQKGEPLQYIAASAPFYGRDFFVKPGVLIPRPETERLVELALNLLASMGSSNVLDIGVGSGVVAITLKAERPDLKLFATDISQKALAIAKKNAKSFSTDIKFARADIISSKWKKLHWDMIVSNPPYLCFEKDKIALDVKKWEPKIALEPKIKSLKIKERAAWTAQIILEVSAEILPKFTVLELSPRVAAMLEKKWKKHERAERVWREADLAGRKRFLLVAWKNG